MICSAHGRSAPFPSTPFPRWPEYLERWHLQSFGDNYVADNSDRDAAAGLETNSRTASLDVLRIFLDIC